MDSEEDADVRRNFLGCSCNPVFNGKADVNRMGVYINQFFDVTGGYLQLQHRKVMSCFC